MIDDALRFGRSGLRSNPGLAGSIAPLLARLREIDRLLDQEAGRPEAPLSSDLQLLFRKRSAEPEPQTPCGRSPPPANSWRKD